MKWIVIVLLIALVACDKDVEKSFKEFQKKHKKEYKDAAKAEKALHHFSKNHDFVKAHNARKAAKLEDYEMDVYPFMDDDLSAVIGTTCATRLPVRTRALTVTTSQPAASSYRAGPAAVNFTNDCLPVVDQGQCGSCWSFASVAHLESVYKRNKTANGIPLSQQFGVDCDSVNWGCDGGWPKDALDYLKTSGVAQSTAYPYSGVQQSCKSVAKASLPKICQTFEYSLLGNETAMRNILAASGPIVVAVSVTDKWSAYRSGVFSDTLCPTNCDLINHAVLLVGYGRDTTVNKDFWIVRNSWGPNWGENGYIRMARGLNNNCLTACFGMFAKLC